MPNRFLVEVFISPSLDPLDGKQIEECIATLESKAHESATPISSTAETSLVVSQQYIVPSLLSPALYFIEAIMARVWTSYRGRDRLGAWYLLDACLIRGDRFRPVVPLKLLNKELPELIQYRFEGPHCDDPSLPSQYVKLFKSWKQRVERSLYQHYYDALKVSQQNPSLQDQVLLGGTHPGVSGGCRSDDMYAATTALRDGWNLSACSRLVHSIGIRLDKREAVMNARRAFTVSDSDALREAISHILPPPGSPPRFGSDRSTVLYQRITAMVHFLIEHNYCSVCCGCHDREAPTSCPMELCLTCCQSGHTESQCLYLGWKRNSEFLCTLCRVPSTNMYKWMTTHFCRGRRMMSRLVMDSLHFPWTILLVHPAGILDVLQTWYRRFSVLSSTQLRCETVQGASKHASRFSTTHHIDAGVLAEARCAWMNEVSLLLNIWVYLRRQPLSDSCLDFLNEIASWPLSAGTGGFDSENSKGGCAWKGDQAGVRSFQELFCSSEGGSGGLGTQAGVVLNKSEPSYKRRRRALRGAIARSPLLSAWAEYFTYGHVTSTSANASSHHSADSSVIHQFKMLGLFVMYSIPENNHLLEEHIRILLNTPCIRTSLRTTQTASLTAEGIRQIVHEVTSVLHELCARCLEVDHFHEDCPLRRSQDDELSYDQAYALSIANLNPRHDSASTTSPRIDFEDFLQRMSRHVLTSPLTRPPFCTVCSTFRFSCACPRRRHSQTNSTPCEVFKCLRSWMYQLSPNGHHPSDVHQEIIPQIHFFRCQDHRLSMQPQIYSNSSALDSSCTTHQERRKRKWKAAADIATHDQWFLPVSSMMRIMCAACGGFHALHQCSNYDPLLHHMVTVAQNVAAHSINLMHHIIAPQGDALAAHITPHAFAAMPLHIKEHVLELMSTRRLFPIDRSGKILVTDSLRNEMYMSVLERHGVPLSEVCGDASATLALFVEQLLEQDPIEGERLRVAIRHLERYTTKFHHSCTHPSSNFTLCRRCFDMSCCCSCETSSGEGVQQPSFATVTPNDWVQFVSILQCTSLGDEHLGGVSSDRVQFHPYILLCPEWSIQFMWDTASHCTHTDRSLCLQCLRAIHSMQCPQAALVTLAAMDVLSYDVVSSFLHSNSDSDGLSYHALSITKESITSILPDDLECIVFEKFIPYKEVCFTGAFYLSMRAARILRSGM